MTQHTLSFSKQIEYLHYLIGENHAINDSEKAQQILSRVKDLVLETLKKHGIDRNGFSIDNKVFAVLVDILEDKNNKCAGENIYDNMRLVPLILLNLNKIIALEYTEDLRRIIISSVDNEALEKRVSFEEKKANFDGSIKKQVEIFTKSFSKNLEKEAIKQQLTGFKKEIGQKKIKIEDYLDRHVYDSIRKLLTQVLRRDFSNPSISFKKKSNENDIYDNDSTKEPNWRWVRIIGSGS